MKKGKRRKGAHTKDEHVAAFFLDMVLATDWACAGFVMLDGQDFDQLRVLELGNRLFLAKRGLGG